ncbi:MAG: hypothetical protein JW797_01935 [Bradymonadales bacterium]|nr:hypothetical protein [Bradymonadales bacterium]
MKRRTEPHRRWPNRRESLALALLVVGSVIAGGCSGGPTPSEWIEAAAQANRLADQALAAGEIETARAALVSIIEAPVPERLALEDRRIVRQDMACRLAELEIDRENPDEALRWVQVGLEEGVADDLFTANLHLVNGRALEMLGRDQEAAQAYYQALLINEILLQQSLGRQEEP